MIVAGGNLAGHSLYSFALLPGMLRFAREIKLRKKKRIQSLKSELKRMSRVAALGFSNAALAHHVRNVLSIIMLNSSFLAKKELLTESGYKGLESIINSSKSFQLKLNTYRKLASSNHSHEPTHSDTDLKKIIGDVLEIMNFVHDEHEITCRNNIESSRIKAEEDDLLVLVFNICKNATDYAKTLSKEDKWISFDIIEDESHLILQVSNGSPKWTPENLEDIFEASMSTKYIE